MPSLFYFYLFLFIFICLFFSSKNNIFIEEVCEILVKKKIIRGNIFREVLSHISLTTNCLSSDQQIHAHFCRSCEGIGPPPLHRRGLASTGKVSLRTSFR